MKIKDELLISYRDYFSINHITTAVFFAKNAAEFEGLYTLGNIGTNYSLHKGYVISTILLSVAFLEATINEFFCDCAEGKQNILPDAHIQNLLGRLWERGIPRTAKYPILEKYCIALEIIGEPVFDAGKNPYQDAALLVQLRNALIHYESETIPVVPQSNNPHKFEKKMKGKFPINPFDAVGAFYPAALLGAGCAKWSVVTAISFTDLFFLKIKIVPQYQHKKTELIF